jgi:hypothetical protein
MMIPDRPVRLRSPAHLRRLMTLRCTISGCAGWPVDPHHLTYVQPKARGLKPSDEFCVPLCRWRHHLAVSREAVHAVGREADWWRAHNLDPLPIAARLWAESEGP